MRKIADMFLRNCPGVGSATSARRSKRATPNCCSYVRSFSQSAVGHFTVEDAYQVGDLQLEQTGRQGQFERSGRRFQVV